MSSDAPDDKSSTKHEQELWIASEKYLRGEIKVDELEDAELSYSENLDQATSSFNKRTNKNKNLTYILLFLSIVIIVIGFFAFLSIGNQWLLASLAITVLPLRYVFDYFFKDKEK
jgi:hypothetical protein